MKRRSRKRLSKFLAYHFGNCCWSSTLSTTVDSLWLFDSWGFGNCSSESRSWKIFLIFFWDDQRHISTSFLFFTLAKFLHFILHQYFIVTQWRLSNHFCLKRYFFSFSISLPMLFNSYIPSTVFSICSCRAKFPVWQLGEKI